jgi:hypothetical protein
MGFHRHLLVRRISNLMTSDVQENVFKRRLKGLHRSYFPILGPDGIDD